MDFYEGCEAAVRPSQNGLLTGVVVRRLREHVDVNCDGAVYRCTLSGTVRRDAEPPIVGDAVSILEQEANVGVVQTVAPRRNALRRRSAGPRPVEQVMAANVDQMVVVVAVTNPKPKWTLVDRYLAIAAAEQIEVLICVTKADLPGLDAVRRDAELYTQLGYPVAYVSAERPDDVTALRAQLAGRVNVLVGKSGVGKTTLVNALTDGAEGRTQAVSVRTGKGRHTTTEVAAVALPDGGVLVDTPGVRELGLSVAAAQDLAAGFVELRPLVAQCRFRADCTHTHEKGCAVKAAVANGAVDSRRYHSYLRLRDKEAPTGMRHSAAAERQPVPNAETGFACVHCRTPVPQAALGTRQRNHCPQCLWSQHLDVQPGDRAAGCGGPMEPIAIWARAGGEWALVHRCTQCGAVRTNRVAGDDNEAVLMSLAVRALAAPPFPLERLAARGAG